MQIVKFEKTALGPSYFLLEKRTLKVPTVESFSRKLFNCFIISCMHYLDLLNTDAVKLYLKVVFYSNFVGTRN